MARKNVFKAATACFLALTSLPTSLAGCNNGFGLESSQESLTACAYASLEFMAMVDTPERSGNFKVSAVSAKQSWSYQAQESYCFVTLSPTSYDNGAKAASIPMSDLVYAASSLASCTNGIQSINGFADWSVRVYWQNHVGKRDELENMARAPVSESSPLNPEFNSRILKRAPADRSQSAFAQFGAGGLFRSTLKFAQYVLGHAVVAFQKNREDAAIVSLANDIFAKMKSRGEAGDGSSLIRQITGKYGVSVQLVGLDTWKDAWDLISKDDFSEMIILIMSDLASKKFVAGSYDWVVGEPNTAYHDNPYGQYLQLTVSRTLINGDL